MAEVTEDQVLQKAKELCREDGELWSSVDLEERPDAGCEPVADESSRTEYLNRARAILRGQAT
jgi:hypothetical protein